MTYWMPKAVRQELLNFLGQTGPCDRFLDEMEYWIEVELSRRRFGNLSFKQQKDRFEEIADTAKNLALILGNLDGDIHELLRGMFHERNDSLRDEIPELKIKLERLRDVAKSLAEYLSLPEDAPEKKGGAPRKPDRDLFVQKILSLYYQHIGSLLAYGTKKKFNNVAAILCEEVGYSIGSFEKVTRAAMEIVPSPD